ncbi:MAG: hypothetical protein KAT66_05295 [Candidatus Lokiarchaeota archaeon]|nr:hypothetical protein [Candidatus Lokiarchaeota archaeon]
MVKTKTVAISLIIFLIIGIIHGAILDSFNVFVTWLLISLWIIFTIKILENVKRHREFNSPHNTSFFVIIPLFIGIFYSIWGYFTGILGENLLEGSDLYFSWWSIIFGFPFVLYGAHSLYRCFKKYNVIYFGAKSINARLFGYILTFIVLLFILFYWIVFYTVIEFYNSPLIPLHFSVDLNLLLLFIITILILIVFGFMSSQRPLPALTRDYIAQRTRRINSLTSPRALSSPRTQRRNVSTTTRSSTQSSRTTPTSHRQTSRTRTTKTTQTRSAKPTLKSRNLDRYKPIASYLSQEDFKCIFCFKLPKLPEDRGRGIILCPRCRYPAHADEFKDWLRTSNLCSRCSTPIPSTFKRNPRIISVKNYLIIYKHFLRKQK